MFDLFLVANHLFVLGAIGYCVGDFIRAFFDSITEEQNSTLLEVNLIFFFLSLWFFVDAIVYFKAFLSTLETQQLAVPSSSPSTHIDSASSSSSSSHSPTLTSIPFCTRLSFILRSEIGWAYTLNVVAATGYLLTSLLPCFESYTEETLYKNLDQAQIAVDLLNMVLYSIDAALFLHLCIVEMKTGDTQPNISARPGTGRGVEIADKTLFRPATSYVIANVCNVIASILYLCFNAYALKRREDIEHTDMSVILASGMSESDWFFSHYRVIAREQRAMFFVADLIYLACALWLEWAWFHEDVGSEVDTFETSRNGNVDVDTNKHENQRRRGVGQQKELMDANADSSSRIGVNEHSVSDRDDEDGSRKNKYEIELSRSGLSGDRDVDVP